MATKIIMPKQGLQMTQGTILKWLHKEGDQLAKGEPVYEMETDKLTIEVDAPESGTLLKIIKREGDVVPITKTVGLIGEKDELIEGMVEEIMKLEYADELRTNDQDTNEILPESPKQHYLEPTVNQDGGKIFITPRAKWQSKILGINYDNLRGSGPGNLIIEKDILTTAHNASKVLTTPVATKYADMNSINIEEVVGTGFNNKITKEDVLIAAKKRKQLRETQEVTVIPFDGIRKVIADRMMKSTQTMAQTNHRMSVNMSSIKALKTTFAAQGINVSYNDIFIRILAKILPQHPLLNSSLTENGIELKKFVNIGIAVALKDGLIVPVVKDAHLMDLEEISIVTKDLINKAKNGQLLPEDYTEGSFTISNLGMYAIDEFTAIVNPPESAILAIGRIVDSPVVENGEIVIQPISKLVLSYDHRIIDGAPAALFMGILKKCIENPAMLL